MRDHAPASPTPLTNRLAARVFDRLCADPETGPLFQVLRDRNPRLYQSARCIASDAIAQDPEFRP